MANTRILWADDEIELLRPHIMFLEQKGYEVETANNGSDAVEMVHNEHFDIVFLDEQMPGISGVEALEKIKADFPNLGAEICGIFMHSVPKLGAFEQHGEGLVRRRRDRGR